MELVCEKNPNEKVLKEKKRKKQKAVMKNLSCICDNADTLNASQAKTET